jgi:eukaryotic-like serine/threonine-protein kinase
MSADEAIPPEGRPFGDYVLVRHLARGGMADIFVAKSPVGRPVVVKRIRTKMARDPQFVKLFLREASIAMRLSHGNVAQVFDFGEVDGEYYLAMEYVPGVSLYRLMHHGAERGLLLPFPIAAHIVAEVCRGLDHAHRLADDDGRNLGIVHRDVTPQNILVSYDGEVKLVDFGIARARTEANLTRPGVARGKYAYLSPEQVRQRPVDHRTDVWSCGVVLHQLLSGQHPFPGEVMAVLEAIAGGKFPSPRAVDPTVPDALSSAVMRAMAHDPGARHASAAELERELVGWLHAAGPPLSNETVAAYVRHACPEDEDGGLRGEPVPFPPALADWRRDVTAAPPAPADADTNSQPVPMNPGAIRLRRRVAFIAAAAGILAAVGFVVLSLGGPEIKVSSLIESDPPGARIVLDGTDTGATTPHTLEGLEAGRVHGITLILEGHQTYMDIFTAGEWVHQKLVARAEPVAEPETRRPRLSEVMEQAPAEGAGDAAARPDEWRFSLPQAHLHLDRMASARMALDPERAHHFQVSGEVDLFHEMLPLSVVFFYAIYPDAADRSGFAGGHFGPLDLPAGATEIRFSIIDPLTDGIHRLARRGSLTVRERTTGETIQVDLQKHMYHPTRIPSHEIHGTRRYRIGLRMEGGADGGIENALIWVGLSDSLVAVGRLDQGERLDASTRMGVLEAGEYIEVDGFRRVWLLLPHPRADAVRGHAVATVTHIGPARGLKPEAERPRDDQGRSLGELERLMDAARGIE